MAEWYHCFTCRKVTPLLGTTEKKCPICNGTNGEVLSQERFKAGFDAGVYYNIDPATGKRAKKRRPRRQNLALRESQPSIGFEVADLARLRHTEPSRALGELVPQIRQGNIRPEPL
jgi:hypothetical protein